MGYVSEKRAEKLLEDSLYDWLLEGTIPSPGELEDALAAKESSFGDLTHSGVRQVTLPARFAESSASSFAATIDAIDTDRYVLLNALSEINDVALTKLSEWDTRIKALRARASKLLGRIESLVLIESDTAGYAGLVEEGFRSLEQVASTTTANIDTAIGEVTLSRDLSTADPSSGGTQLDIRDATVTVGLIESGNIRQILKVAGTSPTNILWDSTSRWGVEVTSKEISKFRTSTVGSKPVILEVKIGLRQVEDVSRVVILMSDATAGGQNLVGVQYSLDGYAWAQVPSESPIQATTGNLCYRFPKTQMKWLKIIISKASPDEYRLGSPVYDFGINQVKLYSEEYAVASEGVDLYTETLIPRMGGEPVEFERVALDVCEEIPSSTSIEYFARAYDGSLFTDWVRVSPMSRGQEALSSIVDFSSPTLISSDDLLTIFDSSLDTEALDLLRVDGAGSLAYRFSGPEDTVANFYVSSNDNLLSDPVLLRNVGYEEAKYPAVDTDYKIGNVECGWGLSGNSTYYCDFEVKNPDGLSVDFGSRQAKIDGRAVSGVVSSITNGWHSFETTRANWASLDSSSFTTAPVTEEELKAGDPLYPYNQKYLIEGYQYPDNFSGNKVYLGVDTYTMLRATRIGLTTLLEGEANQSVYALDVIDGPKTIVLLKFDPTKSGHQYEHVRLICSRHSNSYSGIQLRALLKSLDSTKTPVLSYYRMMVQ